ncbi:MAG: rod shape-determining protein MreC [Bacteroidales bacterium]
MKNLLLFLSRNSSWFIALLYLLISFSLVVRNNNYQHSVWLNSSNKVIASTLAISGKVASYFSLQEVNSSLAERNAQLESESLLLREKILKMELDQASINDTTYNDNVKYEFIPAQVINNSVNQTQNYITINRGRADGVRIDMGVVDAKGLVGIVAGVSEHYSVVISLLNTKLRFSCKIKDDSYFGSLTWDGKSPNYAKLEELPRHVIFNQGDTVVTSGYSTIFPEGIMVGRVDSEEANSNSNFYTLKVELSTNFYGLREVRIIKNNLADEQKQLEEDTRNR